MKKNKIYFPLLLAISLISLLFGCHRDDEQILDPVATQPKDTVQSTTAVVNNWIYDVMSQFYYWNEGVKAPTDVHGDPKAYFKSLINEKDRFSYITDDYTALNEELSGVYTSMGYAPTFGRISGTNDVFIAVEYVYPNSPAAVAGLKRGDIILKIDGQQLTTDNYFDLYQKPQYAAGLGTYDAEASAISNSDKMLSLTSQVIATNPVLYHEVKQIGGKKVGYLVYTSFITGKSGEWLNSLGAAIDTLAQAGATELIVDLRYNPGGDIEAAQYLASALAPSAAVANKDVLVKYEYNPQLEQYFTGSEGPKGKSLVKTLENNNHHLNLSRIYFLTGSGTASASELLINGLKPYMEVTTVGETTVGKYYASWVIDDTEKPVRHNWAVMPIVLKYANADGLTDFVDGLQPDYAVDDNLLDAKPFGDEGDAVLATALNLIGGAPNARSRQQNVRKPYQELENPINTRKSNLLIKPDLSGESLQTLSGL